MFRYDSVRNLHLSPDRFEEEACGKPYVCLISRRHPVYTSTVRPEVRKHTRRKYGVRTGKRREAADAGEHDARKAASAEGQIAGHYPFTVHEDGETQPVEYKFGTGDHTGISVCMKKREPASAQYGLLTDGPERHRDRAANRRKPPGKKAVQKTAV